LNGIELLFEKLRTLLTGSAHHIIGVFETCIEITESREEQYGDCWFQMHTHDHEIIIKEKLRRVMHEKDLSVEKNLKAKLDDLYDIINYAAAEVVVLRRRNSKCRK